MSNLNTEQQFISEPKNKSARVIPAGVAGSSSGSDIQKPGDIALEKKVSVNTFDTASDDKVFEENRKFAKKPKQPRNETDFLGSSFISKFFYVDLVALLFKAQSLVKNLKVFPLKFVPYLGRNDDAVKDADRFLEELKKSGETIENISPEKMYNIILRIYAFNYYAAVLCFIFVAGTKLANGMLINYIIDEIIGYTIYRDEQKDKGLEVEDKNGKLEYFYIYLTLLCSSMIVYCFSFHQSNRFGYILTIKIRNQFLQLIYEKILKMSNFQINKANVGKLVNLASNDFNLVEYKMYAIISYRYVWFVIGMGIVVLVDRFGWVGLVTMAVLFVSVALQILTSTLYKKEAMDRSTFNDRRIKLTNELVEGIRLVKMYAWEGEFKKFITEVRRKELFKSFYMFFVQFIGTAINVPLGFVALAIQIAVLVAVDDTEQITFGKIFATLDLIGFLRFQLILSSYGMIGYKEFMNIMKRSKQILEVNAITAQCIEEDQQKYQVEHEAFLKEINENTIISLKNYSAFWRQYPEKRELYTEEDKNFKPVIEDLTFEVKKGETIGIVGRVGAGKTSLLNAFVEEIPAHKGHLYYKGNVSYVEQEPFIFNGTVRDNIILGLEFNLQKYQKVIENCCLSHDFALLSNGDQTEIGEKGVNLSGGQKVRLSLARAIYQDSDIYLLDDPLSAVDSKVGKQLFNNIINGLLKGKTILMATHQVHYTSYMDKVLILKEGKLEKQGTFQELEKEIISLAGEINNTMFKKQPAEIQPTEEAPAAVSLQQLSFTKFDEKDTGKLTKNEEEEIINVQWTTYWQYLKNSGQWFNFVIILAQFSVDQWLYILIVDTFEEYIIEEDQGERKPILEKCGYYILIYFITQSFKYINIAQFHTFAIKSYHEKLLYSLLKTHTKIFDQTPTGNIINRFSNDTGLTDVPLFEYLVENLEFGTLVLTFLVRIGLINGWLFIALFVQMASLAALHKIFARLLRQARILDLRHKSPVYNFFSATIGGILPLRIYKQIETFDTIFKSLVDDSFRSSYYFWFLNRGYSFLAQLNTTIIGLGVILTVAFLTIEDEMKADDVGKILLFTSLTQDFTQWVMRQLINMEIAVGSLERIDSYTKNFEHERKHVLPADDNMKELAPEGKIEFQDVSLRYRPTADLVLKNLNFTIESGEKVGCVGRTGAGKSSLVQALFRMIEIENFEDKSCGIYIDGNRIQDSGLKKVRSSMGIIPQTPFVYADTIRRNLDPKDQFTEEQIWDALEKTDLKETIQGLKNGLQTDMTDAASLFSIGQKQLICLGRVILQKAHIVILDEATANVDMQTDEFIQQKIQQLFGKSTVLTIAHRLNTIADYDKIIVMDKGSIAQYDSPFKLLSNSDNDTSITRNDSIFAQMVKHTGEANAQQIFDIAKAHYMKKQQN